MAYRTDTLTLKPTAQQAQTLCRHGGGRRFAYNACVANLNRLLAHEDKEDRPKLPWSGFDNIAYFNAFKRSAEAGVSETGELGLPWRHEVLQIVFEEGAKDFGRAMTRWGAYCKAKKLQSKQGKKKGGPRLVGPPTLFRKKGKHPDTFRLRATKQRTSFRVTQKGIYVPAFGLLAVRGSTAKLRRRLRPLKGGKQGAAITQLTFKFDLAKQHWTVALGITWTPPTAAQGRCEEPIGCDVGIKCLVATATATGERVGFHLQPKQVAAALKRTRRSSRTLGLKRVTSKRQQEATGALRRTVSKSEHKARRKHQLRHAKAKNIRSYHMHHLSTQLVQTHTRIGIEGLHISGMMKNHRLAGAIARQAWGQFFWQVQYKAAWAEATVVVAPANFPSTKRCSQCGVVKAQMLLSERTFCCETCHWTADRDVNSAQNLAWYAQQSVPVHEKYSVST